MNKRLWIAALMGLALAVLLGVSPTAYAQAPVFNVQHNGVPQFGSNFLQHADQSPVYNFCDTAEACGITVPPIDPIDPLGMNSIIGNYADHNCTRFATNDGQNFGALFGGVSYPYQPPKSPAFSIAPGKRYSAILKMPSNPGTARHFIKLDKYGGSCSLNANAAVLNWYVVAADAVTAQPTGKCSGTSFAGDRSNMVTFNPSNATGTDNPLMCNLRFGKNYRVMIDPIIATPQFLIITYQ